MKCITTTLLTLPALVVFFTGAALSAQTITVGKFSSQPVLDGSDAEWRHIEVFAVPLTKNPAKSTVEVSSVSVRAATYGDDVYFFLQWDDSTRDDQHKPFIWDAAQNKYVGADIWEDRIAIQFAMKGDYTVDWFSGASFEADMWHWKAARTNPLGLLQDKMTIIGTDPVPKAYKATAANGADIYIQRPSDEGDSFYKTMRYGAREKDIMPKYVLVENPRGSVADVQCKGIWENGRWNLEIRRSMDTGHSDDVVFESGKAVKGGIAVFDRSGDDNHVISDNLIFQF